MRGTPPWCVVRRLAGSVMTLTVLLTGLMLGCSAAPAKRLDADRIHADPQVQHLYAHWLALGEPHSLAATRHAVDGRASWYGPGFHGRQTANGESYDMYGQTAAHRTLPFGSVVRVLRPDTRQFVVVRINDRGPYVDGRIIDLSFGAAHDLDMVTDGVVGVRLDIVELGRGGRR